VEDVFISENPQSNLLWAFYELIMFSCKLYSDETDSENAPASLNVSFVIQKIPPTTWIAAFLIWQHLPQLGERIFESGIYSEHILINPEGLHVYREN